LKLQPIGAISETDRRLSPGTFFMLWLLKLLQRISRIRRRAFGKTTSHWFKDGLSLFGFVNVFDLLPTLLAITLSGSPSLASACVFENTH
jgi:hypothetical protein